jgi:hypothetical protein
MNNNELTSTTQKKIVLNESITIQTKKLGQLKFSTLRFGNILKTEHLIEKSPPDRESFLQVLCVLQLEPKKDRNSLALLSDDTLERVGKKLLNKNKLFDRYEKIKRGKGNFFSKFTGLLKPLVKDSKKSQENFANRIQPLTKLVLREKSQMERMADILDSPFKRILEEEKMARAKMKDILDPPCKKEMENLGKSLHEQITGLRTISSNRITTDFGKTAYDLAGGTFMKEYERLMKEAEEAQKLLDPSISMTESLKNQSSIGQQFIDEMQLQMETSNRFTVDHKQMFKAAEKLDVFSGIVPVELNFKDTLLGMMPSLMKMQDWQAEATVKSGVLSELSAIDDAVRKATGEFSRLMKIGKTVAADIKKLYGGMSPDEINRYQEMWQPSNFPAFLENPLNAFGDYISRGEKWGYFTEAEIDNAKSIQSFLWQLKEKLPLLSKQTKALCAVIAIEFVKTLKDLGDRLENGTLTTWTAGVAVIILSTQVLILYYQFMNEKPDDNEKTKYTGR